MKHQDTFILRLNRCRPTVSPYRKADSASPDWGATDRNYSTRRIVGYLIRSELLRRLLMARIIDLKSRAATTRASFRFVAALFVLSLIASGCGIDTEEDPGHASADAIPDYRINLDLDPADLAMAIEVRMTLEVDEPDEPLQFLLHSDLKLETVEGPGVAGVTLTPEFDPFGNLPESHITLVDVHLDGERQAQASAEPGEPLELEWRYSGWIASERVQLGPDAFHNDWVELDMGSLWVPTPPQLADRFTYQAHVTIPEEYTVVGPGAKGRQDDTWSFVTETPHLTASLAIAPAMNSTTVDGDIQLTIHNPGEWKETERLAKEIADVLALYVEWFGPLPFAEIQMVLPPDQRARPEGYQRDRYVMLAQAIAPGEARLAHAAHELAHFWWSEAPPQGPTNFLNESFAEYGSWLALERLYGEQSFEKRIVEARDASRDVGSIHDWTPQTNGPLVYARGPVLLHELPGRMGDGPFFSLLRDLHDRTVTVLDEFFALVETHGGELTAQWLMEEF